ncbi:MAG: VOC family protein [Leptolyngbya sp. IPPAS B-1204]|uniref:VOC family protein n=1 Tax=Leptolyngbya sp. NK1-12 TaxID=2547451 RepID=A0AA96WIR9_9CYAN|nr:VOC family protein [Leptolyngbya sp. NK1-12]MBF2046572.1 VOC family protein [Elainella sp. C42_A2020_010]RNJ70358.1 MAG: VOC family protein [Leptolyngbya sp. IPPAS B-1204]WNZ25894.1 VOC family protein [Leptolyngbya sp. NK1-12]
MHHASIRTADIHRAIGFYELLGFQVCERFTAGITLGCWMEGLGGRIELLQVPEPRPAADAFHDEHYTGYYHLSFDLTDQVDDLPAWLEQLKAQFQQAAQTSASVQPLKVLLEPTQQMIGNHVYEVAFISDTDGLPLEFLRMMATLNNR